MADDTQVQGVPQGLTEEKLPVANGGVQGVPQGLTEEALPKVSSASETAHPAGWHPPIAKAETKPGLIDTANEYYEKGTGPLNALGRLGMMVPNTIRSTYRAVTEPPKNVEETAVESGAGVTVPGMGRAGLAAKRLLYDPQAAEASKSKESAEQGHYSEAAGHGLAAALPLVGPYAANIGERAGRGDISGAATEALGAIALPKIAEEAMPGGALPGAAEEGARPLPAADSVVRGASKVAAKVTPAVPYAAGMAAGHPFLGSRIFKAAGLGKVPEFIEEGKYFGLPEEEANLSKRGADLSEAQKELNAAQKEVDSFKASTDRGLPLPEALKKRHTNAVAEAAKAQQHYEAAQDAVEKAKTAVPQQETKSTAAEPDKPITTEDIKDSKLRKLGEQAYTEGQAQSKEKFGESPTKLGNAAPTEIKETPKVEPKAIEGKPVEETKELPKRYEWAKPEEEPKVEPERTERRAVERKAPMSAAELEDAMKNRKPIQTPFDVTEGANETIKKDLEEKGLGNPKAKEAEPKEKEEALQLFKEDSTPKKWLRENKSETDDHAELETSVMDLPKEEFKKAAVKAGVPLHTYDIREALREGGSEHPTGRQQIARQIVQKLTPEAIENFLRNPEETKVAGQDQSNLSKAERAKRQLKNLYE